jgi:hypothetical protein
MKDMKLPLDRDPARISLRALTRHILHSLHNLVQTSRKAGVGRLREFFACSDVAVRARRLAAVMTIHAQLPDRPAVAVGDHDEPTTAAIEAQPPLAFDPLSLLDHRTRNRTISLALAPPGRYLAVTQAATEYLIPLSRPLTHLGRGLAADIRIADPRISRRHAILAQRDDGIRVLDDRSSNGTFVNGHQVEVASLHDGDEICVGPVVMRYIEIRPAFRPPAQRRIPIGLIAARRRPVSQAV